MKIRIYGASDDLIEVEGCEGADEFYSYERESSWHGDLRAPNGEAMRIRVTYDGCWSVGFSQADEDGPFPEWPIAIRQHASIRYSTVAEIDAPDGTVLENVWPTQGGSDD